MEVRLERVAISAGNRGRSESLIHDVMRDSRLLKFIADHLGTVFFKLDPAGRLELFGPPLEQVVGYRIDEIADYAELIHPEDRPMVVQAHTQLQDDQEIDLAFRVTHRNGSIVWLHERVFGTDGEPPGRRTYYGFIEDITGPLALENREKERSRKMHRLNRLLAELNECAQDEAGIDMLENFSRQLATVVKSEQSAARLLQQQSVLDTVIKAVSRRLDTDDILTRALKEILRALKMNAGASFVDRDGTLRLVAAQGLAADTVRYLGRWPRASNLAAAGVGDSSEVVVLTKDGMGRRLKRLFALSWAADRIVLIPLARDGRAIGLLMLGGNGDGIFTDDDKILAGLIGQEVAIALENARLYQEARRSQLMLRRLATNLLRTEDEVKRRLARELHDQVGHTLAGAKITLGLLKKDLRQEKKGIRDLIGDVEESIDESIKASRQMIYDMYPAALEDVGLVAFMESYADAFRRRTGIELELRLDVARRLPVETESVIFRLVQEALNNMAKHSGTDKGRLSIEISAGTVRISIVDWGRGFDRSRVLLRRGATGIGLSAMGERVESIGGQMTISSKVGRGTEVSISLPGRYPRKKGQ